MPILKTYSISADIALAAVNELKLDSEIRSAGCISDFYGVCVSGNELGIAGEVITYEAILDTVVLNHCACSLDELKTARRLAVDVKTGALIGAGFTYDGVLFSLSATAQMNWTNILNMKHLFTFPLEISTKVDGVYTLAYENLDAFIDVGRAKIYDSLTSGRALKLLINAATTVEELNAVVDNRV